MNTLKLNDKGSEVLELQKALNFHGANLIPDGHFGELTLQAIKTFQRKNDLLQDGIVGPMTWSSLTTEESKSSNPVVTLIRNSCSPKGTTGILYVGNEQFCKTLELNDYDNIPSFSCIPTGTYKCVFTYSPAFGRNLYLVTNVPGRSGIRFHPASFGGDTRLGYQSDLKGCIALGDKIITNEQHILLNSRQTMAKFEKLMGGMEFTLVVK